MVKTFIILSILLPFKCPAYGHPNSELNIHIHFEDMKKNAQEDLYAVTRQENKASNCKLL